MNIAEQTARWQVNYAAGYVGFTITRHSFVSAGIQWFEKWDLILAKPPPSHTFIITGSNSTIEAFPDGVHEGTLNRYLFDEDVCLLVRRPRWWDVDLAKGIVAEAEKHIGEKYGFRLIGALAIANSLTGKLIDVISRRRFSRWLTRKADSAREQICSELVARALQAQPALANRGCLVEPPANITPAMLFKDVNIFEPENYAVELLP